MYVVENRRVISHAVPMEGYLRGAALRSPLDLSFAFASEQTIDELAYAIKMDPLEFRRKNIGAGARALTRAPSRVAQRRRRPCRDAVARLSGDSLGAILHDWAAGATPASIRSRLQVTLDQQATDSLYGGNGTDWFWSYGSAEAKDLIGGETRN